LQTLASPGAGAPADYAGAPAALGRDLRGAAAAARCAAGGDGESSGLPQDSDDELIRRALQLAGAALAAAERERAAADAGEESQWRGGPEDGPAAAEGAERRGWAGAADDGAWAPPWAPSPAGARGPANRPIAALGKEQLAKMVGHTPSHPPQSARGVVRALFVRSRPPRGAAQVEEAIAAADALPSPPRALRLEGAWARAAQVPPPPRTKWTRRVPHPVLIGHAA
jgi:hypothetical protein